MKNTDKILHKNPTKVEFLEGATFYADGKELGIVKDLEYSIEGDTEILNGTLTGLRSWEGTFTIDTIDQAFLNAQSNGWIKHEKFGSYIKRKAHNLGAYCLRIINKILGR